MPHLLEIIGPCMKQISVTVFDRTYTFKKVTTGLSHIDNKVIFNTIRGIIHNPDSTITNPQQHHIYLLPDFAIGWLE